MSLAQIGTVVVHHDRVHVVKVMFPKESANASAAREVVVSREVSR